MEIIIKRLNYSTKGTNDLIDISSDVQSELNKLKITEGLVNIFVVGSTAAITMFEYESGLISDIRQVYENIAPEKKHYLHNETWNDANGFSHIRSALQGQGLSVPFQNSKLLSGTWQQIVLAEFDTRPRQRDLVLTFIGQ
ncbi:MAG: YjbQ family protein [Candidatus Omnitrophota bacterium]|nr:MAG: YjbQ family protein [Candidatus Omnitrophota bacterium]